MASRRSVRIIAQLTGMMFIIVFMSSGMRLFSYFALTNASTPYPMRKIRLDFKGVLQVFVPSGCFLMGSDTRYDPMTWADEQPSHNVCISRDYWLDRDEVTNESYQKFVDDGGYLKAQYWSSEGWQWLQENKISGPKAYAASYSQPKQARIGINWFEADAYARWRGGRLPSEAEWEYAARGPNSLIYPWGNKWDDSQLNSNTDQSWVGAYNMGCNALEWVWDWYDAKYFEISPKDNPLGPTTGISRVLRGGAWDGVPGCTRAATRKGGYPDDRGDFRGIRVMTTDSPLN
jgi:formylglycine-generating enzyme required for sulfatase activity